MQLFEDLDVLGHKLKLKGKTECAVQPMRHGQEVFLIVRAKVTTVAFVDEEDYGALVREHTAAVEEAFILPESASPAIAFEHAKAEAQRPRPDSEQADR